jgi:hypothetical protein
MPRILHFKDEKTFTCKKCENTVGYITNDVCCNEQKHFVVCPNCNESHYEDIEASNEFNYYGIITMLNRHTGAHKYIVSTNIYMYELLDENNERYIDIYNSNWVIPSGKTYKYFDCYLHVKTNHYCFYDSYNRKMMLLYNTYKSNTFIHPKEIKPA